MSPRSSKRTQTEPKTKKDDKPAQTPQTPKRASTRPRIDAGDVGDHAEHPHVPDTAAFAAINPLPLTGVSVYIIHIKDTLTDGPPPGDKILQELRTQGEEAGLGCEFHVPVPGEGIWL